MGSGGRASLHVHCHVSGEERWLAPPGLRDFIFRREMPLVRPPSLAEVSCLCPVRNKLECTSRFAIA